MKKLTVLLIVLLLGISPVFSQKKKNKKETKEQIIKVETPEEYNTRAFAIADIIMEYCKSCYSISALRQECWREAIYDKRYKNPLTGV
jgi:predicted lipoprotein